ncbi:MAG: hypothetical protein IT560_05585 [Alphaproteobacteria bacterium]|nr:hypothetical protein [Alphaproteobacteria bacterium]
MSFKKFRGIALMTAFVAAAGYGAYQQVAHPELFPQAQTPETAQAIAKSLGITK